MTARSSFEVRRLSQALGAEVRGVDLARLDDAAVADIGARLLEHLVLFFPDQTLSLDEHVALGQRFGELGIHPETGRRSLLVNEHFTRRIVELSQPESDVLLAFLVRWATQERFTVRYRWAPGTFAMWDNRCTQHFVVNDFDGERVIQRVAVL